MARSCGTNKLRMPQAETHAAHAEERIVLVRKGEIRHDFVAADIERADDQAAGR